VIKKWLFLDWIRLTFYHFSKLSLKEDLKGEIRRRNLSEPLHCGRIYKVVPANAQTTNVLIPDDPEKLVTLLEHENGWVRDKAQQRLVEGKYKGMAGALRKLLGSPQNTVAQVHALWTLEGLELLEAGDVLPLLQHSSWPVRMNALSALPSAMTPDNFKQYIPVLESMLATDTLAVPLIAFNIPAVKKFDKHVADKLLEKIVRQYPANKFVADAAISNVEDMEADFLTKVKAFNPDTSLVINKRLRSVLGDIEDAKNKENVSMLKKKFPEGFALYNSTCQTCHGADGNGVKTLAPPVNRSEWVNGDNDKLAAIVLFGLTGPITVNGKFYDASEISGDMPGIGSNPDISDEELAQLLSFIRASWSNGADKVDAADIARVRQKYEGRAGAFTVRELNDL
jgi:mono/diheme cytochrome c family protein